MSANPRPLLTPEQYLEIERAAEFRSEFYQGRMYAMSAGTFSHATIIGNLAGELHTALRRRSFWVACSCLRVCVSRDGLYTYPDVVVVHGEPKSLDGHRDTLLNPIFVAEVLSPSTEAYDRGFKSTQYRTIESLQEYALVSQAEPRIEIFRRQPAGEWLFSESAGLSAVCRLHSLDCEIALADLYDKVTFGEDLIPPRPPSN